MKIKHPLVRSILILTAATSESFISRLYPEQNSIAYFSRIKYDRSTWLSIFSLCFTYQAALLMEMVRVGLVVAMACLALVLWGSHLLPDKVINKK